VLVGGWDALSADPDAPRLGSAPSASGVFARFSGETGTPTLQALDVRGDPVRVYGAGTGLIAATRTGERPPVWVITGTDEQGAGLAAAALGEHNLRNRYAALVSGGRISSLPASSGPPGTPP
jgi:hypothetical protein